MDEAPEGDIAPLKFLKALVTTLTVVMIVGFIVLIGLLVTRFGGGSELAVPSEITLPDGATPIAFTQTAKWYAVVTSRDEILIFDAATGEALKTIKVQTAD